MSKYDNLEQNFASPGDIEETNEIKQTWFLQKITLILLIQYIILFFFYKIFVNFATEDIGSAFGGVMLIISIVTLILILISIYFFNYPRTSFLKYLFLILQTFSEIFIFSFIAVKWNFTISEVFIIFRIIYVAFLFFYVFFFKNYKYLIGGTLISINSIVWLVIFLTGKYNPIYTVFTCIFVWIFGLYIALDLHFLTMKVNKFF